MSTNMVRGTLLVSGKGGCVWLGFLLMMGVNDLLGMDVV